VEGRGWRVTGGGWEREKEKARRSSKLPESSILPHSFVPPSLPPSLHPSLDSLRNELQALMEESEDFMPLLAQEGAHAVKREGGKEGRREGRREGKREDLHTHK